MATKLTIEYDEVGDILYLDVSAPTADQIMVEIGPGAMLRRNTLTGIVEGVEIVGFLRRAKADAGFEIPVGIELHQLGTVAS